MVRLKDLVNELKAMGFSESDEVDLKVLSNEVIALVKSKKEDFLEQKILSLIQEKPFSERVQGRFEKFLSDKGIQKLGELLDAGKVEIYKKAKYKKGVYVLSRQAFPEPEKIQQEKPPESNEDFFIINNEFQAKALSNKFAEQIKKGLIKGVKSFDGTYYVAKSGFLEKWQDKVLKELKKQKQFSLTDLAKNTGWDKNIIKMVLEFLKESGEVLEKRKEFYELIT